MKVLLRGSDERLFCCFCPHRRSVGRVCNEVFARWADPGCGRWLGLFCLADWFKSLAGDEFLEMYFGFELLYNKPMVRLVV
jgi:hypothetical protein